MHTKRAADKMGRAKEEDYFRQMDAELIQESKRKQAALEEHEHMKRETGISDDAVVAELKADGYDRETIRLLHLAPLIQVAWAHGEVPAEERRHILEAARIHGVAPGSRAHECLTSWLETRPSDQFFRKSLRAIRAILHSMEPELRETRKLDLLELCTKTAKASGGFFGLGSKISASEKALLAEITAELERAHGDAAGRVAASMRREWHPRGS
jgi:hypothetical protein